MSTPLNNPLTINITINTHEELLALLLRANLDDENLRHWYHDIRGKTNRVIPDVRLSQLYKILKDRADEEGVVIDAEPAPSEVPDDTPCAKSVDVTFG
jgi:hypothetical protein